MNLEDEKIHKIDPAYIASNFRIDLGQSESFICSDRSMMKDFEFPNQYGTITEFYFMLVEMLHFGLSHM